MVNCAVSACGVNQKNNPKNYTYHRFPLDPIVREKWLRLIGRVGWTPRKTSTICSKHFHDQYKRKNRINTVLVKGAVPTLFVPNQSQTGRSKQRSDSTSSPSESTDFGSSSKQIEKKQEEMASSAKSRKRTSLEASTPSQSSKVECRVCLQYVSCEDECCDIFNSWNQNPEATISCYFTQVTNIQVSSSDRHTKYICFKCLDILQNCVLFIERAQLSDTELQRRYNHPINQVLEPLWPKPIQIDKCLNNENKIEVEVKQEVLSEDEVPPMETDNEEFRMDIKVEPEEYSSFDCSPQIMDTISITPIQEDEIVKNSDINIYEDENYLEDHIKEEPVSEGESEVTPDLPLDCMLCTKTFHSVSGLKAHVIAQHSYLTIARKTEGTPAIYECFTCRRTFLTHTDLIVHETCHGEYACYMCNSKFETFILLTKHRKRCRYNGDHASRLKTLDDVKRPSSDLQHTETADLTNKKVDSINTEQFLQKIHVAKTGDLTIKKSQPPNTSKIVDSIITEQLPLKIHVAKTGDLTIKKSQPPNTSKIVDSIITEQLPLKIQVVKTGDLTTKNSQPPNTSKNVNSINTEQLPLKIHVAKTGDLTIKKSQPPNTSKLVDSINTEQLPQKIHVAKTGDLTIKKSQPPNTSKLVDSIITEQLPLKIQVVKTGDLTTKNSQPPNTSINVDSINTEQLPLKIHVAKTGDLTIKKSQPPNTSKIVDSINTEQLPLKIQVVKTGDLTTKNSQPPNTSKNVDSINTEQLPLKIQVVKTGDLTTKISQPPNISKKVDSINTELDSQKMHHTKEGDSTKTELKSQETHHPDAVDSTNTELESQKVHLSITGGITNTESQALHHSKTADSINTESQSHLINSKKAAEIRELERHDYFYVKAADLNYTESLSQKIKPKKAADSKKSESHKIYYVEAAESTDTESQSRKINLTEAAESTDTESQSRKINLTEAADSKELESHKIYFVDSIDKELQPQLKKIHQAVDKNVIEYRSSDVKTSNSSIDSNEPNAIKPTIEKNNYITKDNNVNSEMNNLDFEVNNDNTGNNANSDLNNSVLYNSNSEINNSYLESNNQNQDLETQSIKSEDFNLTYNSSNEDLNSLDLETHIKIESTSELSQGQSLNINSKLECGSAEMASNVNVELNSDHIPAKENVVSERNNLTLDSDNVTDGDNSVSKNSNLESDNKESVVETNETTKSQAECANMSLEVSKRSIENTPNILAESDSMKIHLEIHSLKNKSLDISNDGKIDEEMIENTESNDEKVLQ